MIKAYFNFLELLIQGNAVRAYSYRIEQIILI